MPMPEFQVAAARPAVEADIVCVGFGPATAGFLETLSPHILGGDRAPALESAVSPGRPLQVVCFERADGLGFGVSGVVTRARGIRSSWPGLDVESFPFAVRVRREAVVYLLDPVGASRRSRALRTVDALARVFKPVLPYRDHAVELPAVPSFLRKQGGLVLSIGRFTQWVSERLMADGAIQVWPSSPVAGPLFEGDRVVGVRLVDQGTDRQGRPGSGFMPGMDVRAALTVVGDGPVGQAGQQLDRRFGLPGGHHPRDWAIGVKMVVDLRPDAGLEPGTVLHTAGYPEPELFGFLYVHADGVASIGLFVPSWFDCPVRTAYRYLQHWMQHPYLWKHLEGGSLRSWGAKSLQESGLQGEPHLVGDGYARIGEGSGTTNVLAGSGVDEAWTSGSQLAEAVVDLLRAGQPFTRENLDRTYVARRRASWVGSEGRVARHARNGFHHGLIPGLIGLCLAAVTRGHVAFRSDPRPPYARLPSVEDYYRGRIPADEVASIGRACRATGVPVHDALMERSGWPPIPYDGRLLVSHQDAMLMGGKVQAPPGYADHVAFLSPDLCRTCGAQVCVETCSGQAILPGADGVPTFDRDKCVHCGACLWNCSRPVDAQAERTNIEFRAGAGGLHSGEN
jgi:electron-transferring-flavoprotein dehydrogenase